MDEALKELVFLTGEAAGLLAAARPRPPFDEEVVDFLDAFGRRLLKDKAVKAWPDVVTLGFWHRRASLLAMKAAYPDLAGRLGRGLVFHVAPANVAVNFAYSLAAGLLAGNANAVRVPSRDFPQTDLISRALNETLAGREALKPYVFLVRYGRQAALTEALSALCDARIIWGGDESIRLIRRAPLKVRAVELAFADRHSLAVIRAAAYLALTEKERAETAGRFYNDTLLTDQLACSAPSLVVWLGEEGEAEEARALFWRTFETAAAARYELQPALAVARLTAFQALCAAREGVTLAGESLGDLIFRVQTTRLTGEMLNERPGGGYFLEYTTQNLAEILPVCGERCQTLAVLGAEEETLAFLERFRPAGADRVAPLGRALDFSLKWDGHDLIYALTRCRDFMLRKGEGGL